MRTISSTGNGYKWRFVVPAVSETAAPPVSPAGLAAQATVPAIQPGRGFYVLEVVVD